MKKNHILFLILVLFVWTVNAQITLSQSNDNTTVSGSGVACWNATTGEYNANSFLRAYNLADFGITEAFDISSVEYGQGEADDGKIITCNIYTATSDDITTATLTLVGTANHTSTATNDLGLVSVALSASIPAGSTIVFEVFAADSGTNTGESFFPGFNDAGENDDSYILAPDCGITEPTTTATIGFPDNQYVMNVVGDISCENNITFCYVNNDTTEYTFTTDDGAPLTVIFNEGQVENNSDALIVLDSDGVTNLNGATPYGNGGNLAGLTFTSSGDTITISVQSNGSINCQENGYTPINFSISSCLDVDGLIEVNAYIDENSNGVFDTSEINFSDGVFTYEVNNDGIINYVNSSTGNFRIPTYDDSITYDLSFIMYEAYNSCLSQTFTLVEDVAAVTGETVQVDFPLTPITDCSDVGVFLLSYIPPRPGLINYNTLIIENLGILGLPISGSVEFTYDPLLTLEDVLDVDPGNTVVPTATGFILNFNDLQPNEQEVVIIGLNVPTSAMAGDLLTNSVIYSVSDFDISNNESVLTEIVVNSYDPNDKAESHGGKIEIDDFTDDDYLFYTIRFQNLGTAEAIDIRVEDVLDAQLDTSTFKMLVASHDYVLTRIDNELTWEFESINLPSESMDEPNSHGYVYFRIKPLAGYAEGDIIPNFADIYFDFNPAVTTNTFETEFVASLSVDEFSSTQFNMYPNPANATVNVQFNSFVGERISVGIYDIQGKLVFNFNSELESNKIQFDVSTLSQGMYFVELKGDIFKTVEKLIIE